MSSFVALADSRLLDKTCRELADQFEFTKKRNGLWLPGDILGVWVGPHASLDLRFESSFGFLNRWMMVCLDEPGLTRAALVDTLVSRSGPPSRDAGPRFMPVFPRGTPSDVWHAELAQMRSLHPDEIGDPLWMSPMTGALSGASSPVLEREAGPNG